MDVNRLKRWLRDAARIDYRLAPRENDGCADEAILLLTGRLVPLYLVVLAAIWICALRFYSSAPVVLSLVAPGVFTALISARLVYWRSTRRMTATVAQVRAGIRQLQLFSPIIGLTIVTWALSLYPYGDTNQQDMVHVLSVVSGVVAILCLGATPFAASLVACSVIAPSTVAYFLWPHPNGNAIAILQSVVFAVVVRVAFSYQGNFLALSHARRRLAQRHEQSERLVERTSLLASEDPLTGLFNRRAFLRKLEEVLPGPAHASVQLAMIDLDGFKDVNDSLGHGAGDALLVTLAKRLRELLPDAVIGRLGGDEFAVIFAPERPVGRAKLIEVATSLSVPIEHEQLRFGVSASLGFLDAPSKGLTVKDCLERADHAMYSAKTEQGPSVVVYGEKLDRELQNKQQLISTVSRPGFEQYLGLAYQPIIDTRTKAVVGVEALARWNSPGLENISAGSFISMAENCGHINAVTHAIVERAVKECRVWESGASLFINISGRDLIIPDALDQLAIAATSTGAPPDHIVFEVTETALVNIESGIAGMNRLKAAGFRFALDDFGSGQSSLSRVHRLPIDVIKIDGAFIEHIAQDVRCRAAIGTVLELSRQMKVDCVVEGIETFDQSLHASHLGAKLMQGYYFAKPTSAGKIMELLDKPLFPSAPYRYGFACSR
ncbi:EAL domain-containing protein [Sphingomonas edaphi]|uniref:EAL domain-containing protein n=1 Tax=Sphingomonas edaphi TaxID=2315689 RepID=A0A418PY92_9SPHN|nr:EAL domain-containing protein [Sphingomonas edaphi]